MPELNYSNDGGERFDHPKNNTLRKIWQGWLDEDRTFSSVDENAILESGKMAQ